MRFTAIAILAVALPAAAHHSHGNYKRDTVDMVGTVKKAIWVNPHSFIYVDVRGKDGKVTTWGLETNNPAALKRFGVTKDYLKPGDEIKIRCLPLADGGNACLLGWIQKKGEPVKDWDANLAPPVDDGFFDIR